MPEPITVMIVDDHQMVRNGARGYLEVQPEISVVAEAESGEEAVRLAREFIPDVVLMDLVMPGMDGVEATRKVKDISPRTQIIILTSFHEDEHIFPALQAGAISYLLKDVKAAELVEAIRRAAVGEATLHPRVASRLIKQFSHGQPERGSLFTELTEREVEVLTLVARGFTNQKIADDLVISVGTVKGHVSNILSKLHLADRTQAAVFAWQEGIVGRE
ncbi:MAG: response regulator transcription factor [Thermoleophilia bacterium]|nr:response regulator transcription factor [Thermoleophilia bacterium]